MTATRAPLAVARAGIGLATRTLPSAGDRARYRTELLAQLYELSPPEQLRFTGGVLSQSLALRAALSASPSRAEEDAMTITRTRPFSWRCRVFRWHRWVMRSTEDGGRYMTCARCDQDRDNIPFGSYSIGPPGSAG